MRRSKKRYKTTFLVDASAISVKRLCAEDAAVRSYDAILCYCGDVTHAYKLSAISRPKVGGSTSAERAQMPEKWGFLLLTFRPNDYGANKQIKTNNEE